MKIIAVDDERIALAGLESILKKAAPAAEVLAFRRAEEALEYAGQERVDIAFLDVRMQEMNGLFLAERLKETNAAVNIIFVTGYDEYAREAIALHASGYITKPVTLEKVRAELGALRFPPEPRERPLLRVQCFGNFEVFTPDGEPVHFARTKAKEVFAYLIHKRGTSCATREIAAVLFEDAPYDEKRQAYFQQIIHAMMKSLRQVGAESVIIKRYKAISVNTEAIDCDFYHYMDRDERGADCTFMGEYMAQYEWAEGMVGFLSAR